MLASLCQCHNSLRNRELSHFTYRSPDNGFDFFMQPVSESTVRTINFGEINFAARFVAYEKLQRFDKINVSQNSLFCPTRTVTPSRWPLDLRVFSQTHTDSPLKISIPKIRHTFRKIRNSSPLLIEPAYQSNICFWRGSFEIF